MLNSSTVKDFEVSQPPTDGISHLSFSPTQDFLAAASWDSQIRIWEVQPNGNTVGKCAVSLDAPVLCTAWMTDGTKVFAGGASKQGKLIDMMTGQSIPFANHDQPIKTSFFCNANNMNNILITGSWDKTIRYWDVRQPNPMLTVPLPERCYAMDCVSPLLVVGTAENHILIYNLNQPQTVFKTIPSPLKFQLRCLANFPSQTGFAVGSIEGRVAIQYIDDKDKDSNFSFKCHRDGNNVYAINAMSFHPIHGTFSTAGSDGGISFWDKDSKQRTKAFNNASQSISSTAFSRNGSIFAYAVSYDWSKGHQHYRPNEMKNQIFLHAVQEADVKPRAAVKKR